MAITGKGTAVYVNGYDLSGYLQEASSPGASQDTNEVTCFGDNSKTYIGGLTDGTVSLSGVFEGAAGESDEVFQEALSSTTADDVIVLPEGDSDGAPFYGVASIATSYEIASPVADICTVSLSAQSTTGLNRGLSLQSQTTETTDTNSATLDNGGATTDGSFLYLQSMTRLLTGSLSVEVKHSATGSFSGEETVLDTFTLVEGSNVYERRETPPATTVLQFVRAYWTITGGSTFTFWVGIGRNK